MSTYGSWTTHRGIPVFEYTADQRQLDAAEWDPLTHPPTRRHFHGIGNRRIFVVVDNEGQSAVWDEYDGLRWLTAPDPAGTGRTILTDGVAVWGSAVDHWPGSGAPLRQFGPTWLTVELEHRGLRLTRRVLCPEGEQPWVLVEVTLDNLGPDDRQVELVEEWALRPRFIHLFTNDDERRALAQDQVRYDVATQPGRVLAMELWDEPPREDLGPRPFGAPRTIVLDALPRDGASATSEFQATTDGQPHPTLRLTRTITLAAGGSSRQWFRFGVDSDPPEDPAALADSSIERLRQRLPRVTLPQLPELEHEATWHAAVLTGMACVDGVLGGHTLDQGSAYSFQFGFNGAARDPLWDSMVLVYLEPDLALSVMRNTFAWGAPNGQLPYALDGAKNPRTQVFQPSDQSLPALWLAAEYVAATGDIAAFDEDVPFHPSHEADPVPLREHLRRHFRHFVDEVGLGETGHVRIMNADQTDVSVLESGVPPEIMIEQGESILNSALAALILPVWAGACERLGDAKQAQEARELGEALRRRVADEWTGRWFRRMRCPGYEPIGDDVMFVELQPFAILCGAADDDRASELLHTIDTLARSDAPLGTRSKWPDVPLTGAPNAVGEGQMGASWYGLSKTIVWAASRLDRDLAWDEFRRMSLTTHTASYPDIWEGTLSGPDNYNGPQSARPGRTWGIPDSPFAMQAFPVNNSHAHSCPLGALLRLMGVEPTKAGTLRIGNSDIGFDSEVLHIEAGGSGRLLSKGPVTIETPAGTLVGGPGEIRW